MTYHQGERSYRCEEEEEAEDEIQRRSGAYPQYPPALARAEILPSRAVAAMELASVQGLTLVHFSAQRRRFL
jgi:hypothetical protein